MRSNGNATAAGLTVDSDGNAIVLTRAVAEGGDEDMQVLCAVAPASRARCVELDTPFGRYAHLIVRDGAVFVQDRFRIARLELAPLLAAPALDPI